MAIIVKATMADKRSQAQKVEDWLRRSMMSVAVYENERMRRRMSPHYISDDVENQDLTTAQLHRKIIAAIEILGLSSAAEIAIETATNNRAVQSTMIALVRSGQVERVGGDGNKQIRMYRINENGSS